MSIRAHLAVRELHELDELDELVKLVKLVKLGQWAATLGVGGAFGILREFKGFVGTVF